MDLFDYVIIFNLSIEAISLVQPLNLRIFQKGFKYHHAKENYVMMYMWLPTDESNNIPAYAHTLVGVGGIVVNDKSQILVVREKYATRVAWKLPGGYAEPGKFKIEIFRINYNKF